MAGSAMTNRPIIRLAFGSSLRLAIMSASRTIVVRTPTNSQGDQWNRRPARVFGRICTIRGTIEFCDGQASAGHGGGAHGFRAGNGDGGDLRAGRAAVPHPLVSFRDRSEEHTSELQSLR